MSNFTQSAVFTHFLRKSSESIRTLFSSNFFSNAEKLRKIDEIVISSHRFLERKEKLEQEITYLISIYSK